ncbi:AarF/UbiB family protein [Desulfobacterales bacterium HSG2]|nr:AarF/UbiB family protein [Desulfobacterales bacterium HSG2]
MIHNLNFENQKAYLKKLAASMSRHELVSFIRSAAEKAGMEKFREQAAEEIIRITKPADVIPDIYGEYRQIAHDGILFLLSNFSPARLAELVADQLMMEENVSVEERLIRLAGQIPTLHKLGQIIARNRNVAPSFRKWLIRLENDLDGSDIAAVQKNIREEIGGFVKAFSIRTDDRILAEASVGAVVAFTWLKPDTGERAKGVFKILRPGIKEYLDEELSLLDETAIFFEKNRERYPLKDFRFIETFRDIKEALQEETDLPGEQANLRKAFRFYSGEELARIPRVLPFSTENLTAMEFMNGGKITDVPIGSDDREMCAQLLFKAVIGHPLFSGEEQTLFHGDPHAGNIFAFEGKNDVDMKVTLLDWSQAGYLSKLQRIKMLRLMIGVITRDKRLICEAVGKLSKENLKEEPLFLKNLEKIIHDIVVSCEYASYPLVKKTFFLIDQSMLRGISFPRELLLFRKAFFTLEGLLHDLDPKFDMDVYMIRLVGDIFMEELPKRWAYLLFLHSDCPEYYRSMLSNTDIQKLANHLFIESFKKSTDIFSTLMEKNVEILSKAFCLAR